MSVVPLARSRAVQSAEGGARDKKSGENRRISSIFLVVAPTGFEPVFEP